MDLSLAKTCHSKCEWIIFPPPIYSPLEKGKSLCKHALQILYKAVGMLLISMGFFKSEIKPTKMNFTSKTPL